MFFCNGPVFYTGIGFLLMHELCSVIPDVGILPFISTIEIIMDVKRYTSYHSRVSDTLVRNLQSIVFLMNIVPNSLRCRHNCVVKFTSELHGWEFSPTE